MTALVFLVAFAPLRAQTLTTAALSGTVLGAGGERLSNVLVTVLDTASGITATQTADRAGAFRFDALPAGVYTLTAERIGFAPRRIQNLDLRPERERRLRIELNEAASSATTIEELRAGIVVPAGAGQWIPRFGIRHLNGRSGTLSELGRFSSLVDDDFAHEGLPGWFSAVAIDGTPFRAASHTRSARASMDVPFTTGGFAAGQVLTNPLDTEWSYAAGTLLSVYTMRGAAESHGELEGRWAGDVLALSSIESSYADVRGGAAVRGAMADGVRFAVGVAARREQTPLSSAWPLSEAGQRLIDADAGFQTYAAPAVTTATAVAGFARLDWLMSERHQVGFGIHAASLPSFNSVAQTGALTELDGTDVVASAGVFSQLGTSASNDLRVSITSSGRADSRTITEDETLPLTMIAHDRLAFGMSAPWSSVRDADLRVTDALHIRAGRHGLKIGGSITRSSHRYEWPDQAPARYTFGDVDRFLARTGALVGTEGPASVTDWSSGTLALFAQDRVALGNGLEIMAGIRVERQALPDDVDRDEEWERLTGLANDRVDEPGIRLSPRASITWDPGGTGKWVVSAAGGIHYDRPDPLLLAEWQHDNGSLNVRRVVGQVAWPSAETGGVVASRLTLLGSGFEAPRTLRATAGLSTFILSGTTLNVAAVVRRTENLPRRVDVNRVPLAAASDQHGRSIYGTLVKQGGLIAAEPGSNRVFTTYDEVAAIVTDRTSRHWGLSVGLERELDAGFGIVARYTFGRTTDDWYGAQHGGWTVSAPTGLGVDSAWVEEATSDFDVPHRLAGALLWSGPGGVRVGAAYRVQSGRPFTPGFRPGVDANADGVADNDPAFIDENVNGMDALLGRWSCLRTSAGEFAARNVCRSDPVHGLDLNLALPVIRFGRGVASVHADVFDLLESSRSIPDAAVYLIDPDVDLTADPVARTVTIPLVANENFGTPAGRQPGRTLRLGLSINW